VDTLLVGGGMAYTFYKSMGLEIGGSLLEADKVSLAAELLREVKKHPKLKFYLPMDCVVAAEASASAKTEVVPREKIPAHLQGLDIGPETRSHYAQIVEGAKLVVWNGPMGVFELEPFAAGTMAVAQALANATAKGATTIIGGGDSALAIERGGLADKVSHVSTGGGASLDLLGGKVLPGVAALEKA
jgi:phosphoglycerate kinase